jgi:hypothetical protein
MTYKIKHAKGIFLISNKKELSEKELNFLLPKERKVYDEYREQIGKRKEISTYSIFGKSKINAEIIGFNYMGLVPYLIFKEKIKIKAIPLSSIEV